MKTKILILSTLLLGIAFSCTEELNKTNPSVFTSDSFFSNNLELEAGVNTAYSTLSGNNLWGREYWFLNDLRSDECATGGSQLEPPRNGVLTGNIALNNSVMQSVWLGCFRLAHRANVVLQASNNYKTINDAEKSEKDRIIAEAKFLRAMAYYELGTMWGGVPLYTKPATKATDVAGRATQDEVIAQVIKDATEASVNLPEIYTGGSVGRAPKAAAQLLAARAMMFKGDYASAKTELLKIKNSGKYALTAKYLDNFRDDTEYNSESIFEVGFDNNVGMNWDNGDGDNLNWSGPRKSSMRHQEYSPVGWRNVIPSDKYVDEFERESKGDTKEDPRMRFNLWFKDDVINNGKGKLETDYPVQGNTSTLDGVVQKISWKKYSIADKTADGYVELNGNNFRLMRYAEVLINLAECENETGNTAGAIALLNELRARADVDLPKYPTKSFPTGTKEQVFAAVQHEKLVEMGVEQLRAKDLLRWRKQGKLAKEPLAYFVKGKHELLPLPTIELDNNPLITSNNPGY